MKLREHLRRCWLVYLVGAVILCLLNNLVYTVTRPRPSEEEILRVLLLNVETALPQEIDGFKEFAPESLNTLDPNGEMLLTAKLITGNIDLCIADEAGLAQLAERGMCAEVETAPEGWALVECPGLEGEAAYAGALERNGIHLVAPRGSDIANINALATALKEN